MEKLFGQNSMLLDFDLVMVFGLPDLLIVCCSLYSIYWGGPSQTSIPRGSQNWRSKA